MENQSAVFETQTYRDAFNGFRRISTSSLQRYASLLESDAGPTGPLLDVGCGTGMNLRALLDQIPRVSKVIGVEPSKILANECRREFANSRYEVEVYNDDFSDFQLNVLVSKVWMSEVAHLLGEPGCWMKKISGLLNSGGNIVIRTSTHSQLQNRDWYQYFPEALELDIRRHPDQEAIINAFEKNGFGDIKITAVDESRYVTSNFVREMFSQKAFSTLRMISPESFEIGLNHLSDVIEGLSVDHQHKMFWDYQMTAYSAIRG